MKEIDTMISADDLFWKIAIHDDEEAFRTLFYTYFPSLCGFAGKYISNKETCEDIVQDTFLSIWRKRKSLEIASSARNYMLTCVKNNCIDHQRKNEAETNYLIHHVNFIPNTCENNYYIKELENIIISSLNKLPIHIKFVFEQNRFEGKTYIQIAKECNLSVKTIESYMSKALKHMRIELEDYCHSLFCA